jgi:hypothetical protein
MATDPATASHGLGPFSGHLGQMRLNLDGPSPGLRAFRAHFPHRPCGDARERRAVSVSQLNVMVPRDDQPEHDYAEWAAQTGADAQRAGHRLITRNLGPLRAIKGFVRE